MEGRERAQGSLRELPPGGDGDARSARSPAARRELRSAAHARLRATFPIRVVEYRLHVRREVAMSPSLSEIGQIAVTVRDVGISLPYYRDVLGLRFLFQPAPTLAFLAAGSLRIMLSTPQGA